MCRWGRQRERGSTDPSVSIAVDSCGVGEHDSMPPAITHLQYCCKSFVVRYRLGAVEDFLAYHIMKMQICIYHVSLLAPIGSTSPLQAIASVPKRSCTSITVQHGTEPRLLVDSPITPDTRALRFLQRWQSASLTYKLHFTLVRWPLLPPPRPHQHQSTHTA